jgi:hypothetical protein
MFRSVPIDPYVPPSVIRDIRSVILNLEGKKAKIRVIRIGAEDFALCIDKVTAGYPAPFKPTLCGIPVEPQAINEVSVVSSRDDDTLTADKPGRSEEVQ